MIGRIHSQFEKGSFNREPLGVNEIIRETMVTDGGEIVNARVREFFKLPVPVSG